MSRMSRSLARPLPRIALVCGVALATGCAPRPAPPAAVSAAAAPAAPARLAAAPDRFFTDRDVTLRYREIGRGQPVVLLHGYTNRLERWIAIADSLASEYRVIALDQRGFGRSSKFADPARYGAELANDVARLLDHLGLRRAHVVGHSMGAIVAADFAVRHPSRVVTVTLAAGTFRDSAATAQLYAPWIAGLERGEGVRPVLAWLSPTWSDSTLSAANRQVMATNDSGALLAVLRAPVVIAPARAAHVRAPTLAVVGSADPLAEDTRRLPAWWPGAHALIVEGAAHGNIVARPEFLAALRAHLRSRAASRPTGEGALAFAHTP